MACERESGSFRKSRQEIQAGNPGICTQRSNVVAVREQLNYRLSNAVCISAIMSVAACLGSEEFLIGLPITR